MTKQATARARGTRRALDRLSSSAFMDSSAVGEWACQFRNTVPSVSAAELAEAYGTDKETAAVIVDLAACLVVHRLTRAEVFRLGTSREAIRLFEERCEEWADDAARTAENVVLFPRRRRR